MYLQNGLYINMEPIITAAKITIFQAYKKPMVSLKDSFKSTRGTPLPKYQPDICIRKNTAGLYQIRLPETLAVLLQILAKQHI